MSSSTELAADPWFLLALVVLTLTVLSLLHKQDAHGKRRRPPRAAGWVPLIGHALAYKEDPAGFLTRQSRATSIFRVDLAGKKMVVVGTCRAALRQVAKAPEWKLSARRAVMEVGFAETLGELNVHKGTALHKRAIKEAFGGHAIERKNVQRFGARDCGGSLTHSADRYVLR